MRDREEIQLAHDMLSALLGGQLSGIDIRPEQRGDVIAATDVLCWVLKHPTSESFEDNLQTLRLMIGLTGYAFMPTGESGHSQPI